MKKKKEKNTGWGGGEEMHRQGTLGASGGKKEEGRKGNEGGVRGRMESWKEERRNQESIREKKEKRTSWTPLCSLSRSLSPQLCHLCATLFPPPPPFSGESALGGKVRALAKAEDQKGNPIKLGLHLSSVHLTSSVIVQPKPPGADRNSPTHVNTNARLRSHQNNRH